MNTSKQIIVMVALLFVAIFATGAYWMWDPGRAEDATDRQLDTTVWRGAFLFAQNCRVCHGDSGEGGQRSNRLREAPPLNRPDLQGISSETGEVNEQAKKTAYKLVFNTLNCGRVGKAMPVWGIEHGGIYDDEQLRQLTTFITEGTGWEQAHEFAIEGFPEGEVHGDAEVPFHVASAISASDTVITLEGDLSTLLAGDRIQLGEELVVVESVEITDGTPANGTGEVTVERGFGTTQAAEHGTDVELLKPPYPAEPVPTVQASCGQIAGAGGGAATPEPPSATLTISSQGIAFDKTELYALPDVPLTLTHNHNDPGQVHNVAFYASEEDAVTGGEAIAKTDLEGPGVQTLNFGPLAAGEYYYQCDAHPQMNGILFVQAATAPADGATTTETPVPGDGAPADSTPAEVATDTPSP